MSAPSPNAELLDKEAQRDQPVPPGEVIRWPPSDQTSGLGQGGPPIWMSAHQSALWRLLRLAGVDTLIDGFGWLMQEF